MGIFSKNSTNIIEWVQNKDDQALVYKHPNYSGSFAIGTKFVVQKDQAVIFVSDSTPTDVFSAGTHQIQLKNLPIFSALATDHTKLRESIKADLYYLNTESVIALSWQTEAVNGNYYIKVSEPRAFLQKILSKDGDDIEGLNQLLQASLNKALKRFIDSNDLSEAELLVSQGLTESLKADTAYDFSKYGLMLFDVELINVSIGGILRIQINPAPTVSNEAQVKQDPSSTAIPSKDDGGATASTKHADVHAASTVVNDSVAENSEAAANAGQMNESLNQAAFRKIYHVMIQGDRSGPYSVTDIYALLDQQIIDLDTMLWHKGMGSWQSLAMQSEFDISKYKPLLEKS